MVYRPTQTTSDSPKPPKGGSSADKEDISMCVEVINGMADTIAELEEKINFICEQLAKDFDEPCNFSPMDEIMLSIGRCGEDCGNVPKRECWRRYFEEVQRRSEQ